MTDKTNGGFDVLEVTSVSCTKMLDSQSSTGANRIKAFIAHSGRGGLGWCWRWTWPSKTLWGEFICLILLLLRQRAVSLGLICIIHATSTQKLAEPVSRHSRISASTGVTKALLLRTSMWWVLMSFSRAEGRLRCLPCFNSAHHGNSRNHELQPTEMF